MQRRQIIVIGFSLLLALPASAGAADISHLNSEVIRTATEYRDQLFLQQKLEDLEVYRRQREVDSRAGMLEKGYISKSEFEQSRTALARAQAKLADTQQRIRDAETIIGEAEARTRLASLPPLPAGGYSEAGGLVRFNGTAAWSLSNAGQIEQFFAARFGRPLPVSARGESEVHRQMHFDHRNAMDVALHPDSPEGRALMDYLRKENIPFIAFRGKVAGSSTGAHIHIGQPSLRLTGVKR
ncbi:MAG TPA: hypothetical protein VKH64_00665 [Candidatus Binatia bacterium]|nr:hypothetical protein [Candidatus Binatia bacterium]